MYSREALLLNKVFVLAEGQTEQAVIRQVLAPSLGARGVFLHDVLLGFPGHKGGIRRFEAVMRDIRRLLKEHDSARVTTLFDRFGLPSDWPGLSESNQRSSIEEAQAVICKHMRDKVRIEMGQQFRTERFMPYIQYYEIEALLFVKPEKTAELLGNQAHSRELKAAVEENGGCEKINNDPSTAPSKRIERLFPHYQKGNTVNAHLPRICAEVGLDELRDKCPLFNKWISDLLAINSGAISS